MFQKNFYQYEKECKQRIGVVFGGIDFYPLKKLSTITAVTRKFYTNWDQAQYQKYIKHFALDESKKIQRTFKRNESKIPACTGIVPPC